MWVHVHMHACSKICKKVARVIMTSGNFFLFHREPLLIRWSTTQSKRRWAVSFLTQGIGNKKTAILAG